jgi:NADP-dependent 3-hydroxy acid dehydrogenase YdfG
LTTVNERLEILISNQSIAITGTTTGIGQNLYKKLSAHNRVYQMNRPTYDLEDIGTLKHVDFGTTDCLILNAGHLLGGKTYFKDHSPEQWGKIISANLTGNLYLMQQYIQQRNTGCIVVVSSMRAAKFTSDALVYSSSKAALSLAVSNLRLELAQLNQPIRLIDVKPSFTNAGGVPDGSGRKVSSYDQVSDGIIAAMLNPAIEEVRF